MKAQAFSWFEKGFSALKFNNAQKKEREGGGGKVNRSPGKKRRNGIWYMSVTEEDRSCFSRTWALRKKKEGREKPYTPRIKEKANGSERILEVASPALLPF